MIIIYSTKKFHSLVNAKLSIKAKLQPRCKDGCGRFAKPAPAPKINAIEKNPLVTFDYPRSDSPWEIKPRLVRLISVSSTHITGLERVGDKWKYKKFLAPKAKAFKILSFNPQAMA